MLLTAVFHFQPKKHYLFFPQGIKKTMIQLVNHHYITAGFTIAELTLPLKLEEYRLYSNMISKSSCSAKISRQSLTTWQKSFGGKKNRHRMIFSLTGKWLAIQVTDYGSTSALAEQFRPRS